jgi:hypothetical protein
MKAKNRRPEGRTAKKMKAVCSRNKGSRRKEVGGSKQPELSLLIATCHLIKKATAKTVAFYFLAG